MKHLCLALAVSAMALSGGSAWAQSEADDYPNRPVNFIVPFPPGGLADLHARTVAEELSQMWGQRVVVENRPGAGGTIGHEAVASSEADGYTMLFANTSLAINSSLYDELPYDTASAFQPVIHNVSVPNVIVVNADIPAETLQDLIDIAKADPGALNFASASSGSFPHLVIELFMLDADIEMTHVPYAGAAPAMAAILGGEVDVLSTDVPGALDHVEAGTLRALAISSSERSPVLPDVPTVAEAGLEGFEAVGWQGIAVPAGTPRPIVEKINADVQEVFQKEEVRDLFTSRAVLVVASGLEEFETFFANDMQRWERAIEASGAQVE